MRMPKCRPASSVRQSTLSPAFRFTTLTGVPSGAGEGLAAGLIEVTLGVKSLAMLPVKQAAPLIAALVSFGGFSVQMQSMFYLEEAGVKGSTFICLKIAQTVFAYAAASLIFAFLTL